MRYILVTLLGMSLTLGVCFAAEKGDLKDQKDKESYSLGYQFGRYLKAQGLEINMDVYTSGIKDALGGVDPLLGQEEIGRTVSGVQQRAEAARQKELREESAKNLAKGKAFMEANGKKEGVKTLPSGMQYKVLVEGSGRTPKATDQVTVNYRGTLIDGTEFDSSYKRGTAATFGADKVISGWKEALQLMKEGSKWELVIPPGLAYGQQNTGSIPPNSTLVFEVELIAVK
jgi:FKBP-type peptidyl-prolyl cis-trans isomerase FklB